MMKNSDPHIKRYFEYRDEENPHTEVHCEEGQLLVAFASHEAMLVLISDGGKGKC